jgi:ADP-glucose pyrophosphorylase
MRDVTAVVLAGGEGRRLRGLSVSRPKPLIPFGGACRLVDFSIANARRSGLAEVLVLPQYQERQLLDDLFRVWWLPDFRVHFGPHDRAYRLAKERGRPPHPETISGPAERGTADALIQKARYVFGKETAEVLVLHADHVYCFDYRDLIAAHRAAGAALTVAYQRIARRYVHLFGMVDFDANGYLTTFVEKPDHPTSDLVSAAFCVFDAKVLHRYLELLDGTDWQHDISRDVIPAMLAGGERIVGYRVRGYWEDIGTVERYYRASLALLGDAPTMSLASMPWTVRPDVARRYVTEAPGVQRSLVPDELVNDGRISGSVVFPEVHVGKGAVVRSSVLLPGARIPAGAEIDSMIATENGLIDPVAGMGDRQASPADGSARVP